MRKLLSFILILIVSILFYSCGGANELASTLTNYTYVTPFPGTNIQLTDVFGKNLYVKHENVPLLLEIYSDKDSNSIKDAKTGEIIWSGQAVIYKDLIFLSSKLADSSWYISAMKINDKLVYGVKGDFMQMLYAREVLSGNSDYKNLILYKNAKGYVKLNPDKDEMAFLYGNLIGKTAIDTLVGHDQVSLSLKNMSEQKTLRKFNADEFELLRGVEFSPMNDSLKISISEADTLKYEIYSLAGQKIMNGELPDSVNKINLKDNSAGKYLLKVSYRNDYMPEVFGIEKK